MRDQSEETLDIVWHPDCFLHDAGEGCYEYEANPLISVNEPHPETAEGLVNVKSVLERGELRDRFNWFEGRPASIDEIALFHEKRYIDFILDAEKNGPTRACALSANQRFSRALN